MTPWNLWEPLLLALIVGALVGFAASEIVDCARHHVDVDVRWKP